MSDLLHSTNSWIVVMAMTIGQGCQRSETAHIAWEQVAQVPDAVGFAGAYAGVSNGHLLVAGGANFPEGTRPWSGGAKQWNDKVFVLAQKEGQWKEVGRLPRPMGYGVSLTWQDGVIMLGGADQANHYRDAYLLRYEDGGLITDRLPDLPAPNANACGALLDGVIYVAGGLSHPADTTAGHTFWSLDLKQPQAEWKWEVLEGWPGPSRMLGVAGVVGDAFYLMSGVALHVPEGDSLARRTYLNDAYRYLPGSGWQRIADLPHAVAAAPSPGYTADTDKLVVFGGDDGSLADRSNELRDKHPGFRKDILAYDASSDSWSAVGDVLTDKQPDPENTPNASTWAPVTTPLVVWDGQVVLPMGEVRPGVRTNRVLMATVSTK